LSDAALNKSIDLAAEMGYEYCLVDNWWDNNIGRQSIAELSKYAQSKGVSLMLWYNSNGYENDAKKGSLLQQLKFNKRGEAKVVIQPNGRIILCK